MKVKSESEIAQSCPTLSHPMDCSLPGSSIHGIFQTRVLEWGAIAFSTCSQESLLTMNSRIRLPHCGKQASLVAQLVKNPPENEEDVKDVGLIPGLGRAPGEGTATHTSVLAWRIPWMEDPGRLQSMGSLRVRHN